MDVPELLRALESTGEVALAGDELRQLVQLLVDQGATRAEIVNAASNGALGGLALDLTLRGHGAAVDIGGAAAEAGLTVEAAQRIWTALGFPDPLQSGRRLDAQSVDALEFLATIGADLIGPDHALALTRAIGAGAARLAEAVVDAFRVRFEVPQLTAGVGYPDVVEQYVAIAREHVPQLVDAMSVALRHHLVEVASGAWTFDMEAGAARRQLCIGFVDLVGYTALAHTSTARTILDVITRFEDLVGAVVSGGGGRVVKLIGDAAMFVVDEPERACRVALDMVEAFVSDPSVPPIRVAVSFGGVVSSNGDYYGDVVNLAARLVAAAEPGTAVATAEAVEGFAPAATAQRLPARALKGFPEPVAAYRLMAW